MEGCIMRSVQHSPHYDANYFSWQKTIGDFGGWANLDKFKAYIAQHHDVLDFGCGGGYLLKRIDCHKRIGIEPNPSAAIVAQQNGVEVYTNANGVPDSCADVVISNNALEHTLNPLDEIKSLMPKIRDGGQVVFFVPCESISLAYIPNDINHHLYSWSPMCLGNLFTEAGYRVIESKPYVYKWPPHYQFIANLGGRRLFNMACWLYGRIERSWFQVRLVAVKPSS